MWLTALVQSTSQPIQLIFQFVALITDLDHACSFSLCKGKNEVKIAITL